MNFRTACEEPVSQRLPAGTSGVLTGCFLRDRTVALFELQSKRREKEELEAINEERKQVLDSLQPRKHELQEELKRVQELYTGIDMFLKNEDAAQAAEKSERERKKRLQREAELKMLKEEYAELIQRKEELQCQVQRHCVYRDFMEQVVKITKFEDVQPLTGHLESLLHFRDQLYQRESETQEQINQQRKALLIQEDQHNLLRLQMNNQLAQLQTELEKTRSEALTWERKWNHIQETAAKKTLRLGQIKMATLNLYEMANGSAEEEPVDMNDTEKQLDTVKVFIQDHDDIVKQHQSPSQRQEKQTKDRVKKPNKSDYKKTLKMI